jgi:hypothetical protein
MTRTPDRRGQSVDGRQLIGHLGGQQQPPRRGYRAIRHGDLETAARGLGRLDHGVADLHARVTLQLAARASACTAAIRAAASGWRWRYSHSSADSCHHSRCSAPVSVNRRVTAASSSSRVADAAARARSGQLAVAVPLEYRQEQLLLGGEV